MKVLVVANPSNTICLITSKYAPSIPKSNFTGLTRLDHNRSLSLLSSRIGESMKNIKNVIIWGNHSKTQYPDTFHATVDGKPLREIVNDNDFLEGSFISKVANRGDEIISI